MKTISILDLLWMMLPIAVVIYLYTKWTSDKNTLFIALFRMIVQLLLIGYVLIYIFDSNSSLLVVLILSVMLIASSVISLRPVIKREKKLYIYAFLSILGGGLVTLLVVLFGVVGLDPWYEARFVIPISGMIFANAMNGVSIAAERFESEIEQKKGYIEARSLAYKAALIPIINSLFAVGLVSLPGMMTGQILSGIDPLIAVRYQMMVMLMVLSSSGLSVGIYLILMQKNRVQ
jgi:putative ABC transport system permease protein